MSKGGGSEQTTTNMPLPEQYEQLKKYWAEAGAMYQQPLEQYGGSTVSSRDQLSLDARDLVGGLGQEEYREAGRGFMTDVLGGEFMGGQGSNPLLDQKFQVMSDRISESYNRIVAPGTAGRFGAAGRSSSIGYDKAEGQDQRNLTEGLGRVATDVYYGDYNNRMQDRMAALGMLPGFAATDRADIGEKRAQGMVEENYSQRQLDDLIAKFNFGQLEPEARLDRFGGRVSNSLGFGTSTQTGSTSSGSAMTLGIMGLLGTLGGAALGGPVGASLGGMLAGGMGGGGGGGGGFNQGAMGYTELMDMWR